MAIYSLAQRTTATAAASASLEIIAAASDRAFLLELGVQQTSAVAGTFGIGRPAAAGVTPTSPVTILSEDTAGPAGTTKTALAWATGPTVPANFFRRATFEGSTQGCGYIFSFPRGLIIAVSTTLVLWIIALAPVCETWIVVDE